MCIATIPGPHSRICSCLYSAHHYEDATNEATDLCSAFATLGITLRRWPIALCDAAGDLHYSFGGVRLCCIVVQRIFRKRNQRYFVTYNCFL